jgi:hypothetical protein
LPFHLSSKLYERTSVIITTNLSFSEWASVFGEPHTAATRGRGRQLPSRCVEGNDKRRRVAVAPTLPRQFTVATDACRYRYSLLLHRRRLR